MDGEAAAGDALRHSDSLARAVDEFLKRQAGTFASALNAGSLILDLHSADVLDGDEMSHLLQMKSTGWGNRELTEEIFGKLPRKSPEQRLSFVRCVWKKQAFLVDDAEILAVLRERVVRARCVHYVCL